MSENDKGDRVTVTGFLVGAVFWLGTVAYTASQTDCMRFRVCGMGDFFLFGIISVGFLVPAVIVALIVSAYGKR